MAMRRRLYYVNVEGKQFRVRVTPTQMDVTWLDCPSDESPGGYGSSVGVAAKTRLGLLWGMFCLLFRPLPTEEAVAADIRHWLTLLDEDDVLDDDSDDEDNAAHPFAGGGEEQK